MFGGLLYQQTQHERYMSVAPRYLAPRTPYGVEDVARSRARKAPVVRLLDDELYARAPTSLATWKHAHVSGMSM